MALKSATKTKIVLAAAVVAVCVGVGVRRHLRSRAESAGDNPLFTVVRAPLDITVTAPGTIRSKNSTIIKSEAQGRSTVIWVIDEGKIVTNGQLLIELDASELEKSLTDQLITVGNTEAALAQSKEKLAIAEIDRDSNISDAQLKLMLAKIDYEKYHEGEYPQSLQDAESKIALAQEEVERATETLNWTRKLAAEGFVTRSDLQADELSLKQKRTSLQSAITSMNLLTNYTVRQQRAKLQSEIQQAERAIDKVTRQSNASVAQAESDLAAKEQENNRQLEKKKTLEEQIAACKIHSPTNGMVIYASTMQASRRRWGVDPLAVGSSVVLRQELIHIPVEGGLVVEFSIPESDLTKISQGLHADIGIDAMPDLHVSGYVSKIGLMPDGQSAWLNPDMNLYNCEISITNAPEQQLRAGMNCSVSMLVASYFDVIAIPLQCVLRVGGESVVFVMANGKPEKRVVRLGRDNGRVVLIEEGLAPGDEVMLAPPLSAGEAPGGREQGDDKVQGKPRSGAPGGRPGAQGRGRPPANGMKKPPADAAKQPPADAAKAPDKEP